jgi:2-keto-4-pentenoate hydratase/2-oxohepta-3-ene-1,7-dioic acid hydratase in catechol pathway
VKLFRFGPVGQERPGVLLGGEALDVSAMGEDYGEAFFGSGGLDRLRAWVTAHAASCPRVPESSRLGPPIQRPSKIVCIGLNYRDHAAEMGAELPAEPKIFMKATSALSGPFDDVELPRGSTKTDYEVELAVVIGQRASYVSNDALDYVAGYAVCNDYSERDFQKNRAGQWVKGKSADTFAPIGPYLVTADEVPDPGRLRLWLDVNGERRQASTTGEMVFGVAQLVAYLSQFMTLLPGDVISTGTPAGVGMGRTPPGYLQEGDIVEYGIEGLGQARQRVVRSRQAAEATKA